MTTPDQAGLQAILATGELESRPSRVADTAAEIVAVTALVEQLGKPSRHALQEVVAAAMRLCHADSAVVSLRETVAGKDQMRWQAVAGALREYLWSALPREQSPTGVVLDLGTPQLLCNPERHFRALAERRPQIFEALAVPMLVAGEEPAGVIWVASHDREHQFDREDLRVLTDLSRFAVAAHRSYLAVEHERASIRKREESLASLNRELRDSLASISNAVEFLWSDGVQEPTEAQQKARDMVRRQLDQISGLSEQLTDEPSIGTHLTERRAAPLVSATRPPRKLKRERVLIIDDSVDSADSLAMLLRAWGHDVRTAQGAVAGLQLEWQFEPHAVVLDIEMPGKNGYEVASELRVRRRRDLLLVALSGYVREEDRARSLAAGFDHHMTKPADLGLLERILS